MMAGLAIDAVALEPQKAELLRVFNALPADDQRLMLAIGETLVTQAAACDAIGGIVADYLAGDLPIEQATARVRGLAAC